MANAIGNGVDAGNPSFVCRFVEQLTLIVDITGDKYRLVFDLHGIGVVVRYTIAVDTDARLVQVKLVQVGTAANADQHFFPRQRTARLP